MNSKYEGKNYFDLPKNCSYNDYLIYCLAKILVHGSENLTCLHETIASIIYNVSPYMTLTTMASSLTLLCLLETAVSNMSLDTSLETSYKVVSLLLDSFNNVLSHGFNNNSYVIFSMILSNKIFYKLDSLSNNTKSNSQIEDEGSHIFAFDKDALALFSTKNIIKFLDILVPQVEKLCEQIDDFDEEYVVKYLKRSTLVGIITKPTQIMARRFEVLSVIENIANWIHLYTWTVIYLRNIDIPLYAGSKVNLFCQNKQQELN
ncbi:hypothetical protein HZS_281 [Henneguya salminicola]|nr:hypothetical protein HZS_281 [Henneguya salminicola]